MPSRTDGASPLERWLRAGVLAALAVTLARVLPLATAETAVRHERFAAAPSPRVRDSLAALARAGFPVSWSGTLPAVAVMAEGIREPRPALRLSVVADSAVVVADTLGVLDSLAAGGGTLTLAAGGEEEGSDAAFLALRAEARGTVARASAATAPAPRRILVLARAGWEAKFVVAALEEAGWEVDARLALSDTMQVVQGGATVPVLSRHAAVVLLDTAGADPAGIARFVRGGGGLLLAGDGVAAAGAVGAIAPARAGARIAPAARSFEEVEPLRALPLVALTALRGDAVLLESRDGATAIAARREGLGRVVQSGFAETWRRRMEGEPGSVAAHRAWWSRLVALALPTPAPAPAAVAAHADEGAPLAALVHALGPPVDAPAVVPGRRPPLPTWLGVAILLLLLTEWGLRRARGAR